MRFGIMIPHFGRAAQPGMVETVAKEAEEMGLDSIWAGDHVIVPENETYITNFVYDPLVVMATAAAVTERIKIGVAVLVIPYRHPVLTANMIATLDHSSQGRIILGAGVGWMEREFAALGQDVHSRGAVTDEYLDCMQALWGSDPTTFHGRWAQFEEMRLNPKPVQQPMPIWVGGASDAAVRRAATRGTGWIPSDLTVESVATEVQRYKTACTEAGRSPGTVCIRATLGGSSGSEPAPLSGSGSDLAAELEAYHRAGVEEILFAPAVRSLEEQRSAMRRVIEEVKFLAPS